MASKKRRPMAPMNEREVKPVKIGQRYSSLFPQVVVGCGDRVVYLMSVQPHESDSSAVAEFRRRKRIDRKRQAKRLDREVESE